MPVDFKNSETKINLMKAFAGESQARNRYTFGSSVAKANKLHVIDVIFTFTANQEKEHAEVFYNHLKQVSGEEITIEADYPVDINESVLELLRYAQRNEYDEYDPIYKQFGDKAKEEGFNAIAASFYNIAEIEKTHGDRFGRFADMLEQNKLFVSDIECKWMCLNCGYIYSGKEVPEVCPVCTHDKGYFIRLELAPYEGGNN